MTSPVEEASITNSGNIRPRKRFADIPCFKNSFLYGISSGIAGGLIYFMFTSKVKTSCHASIATYITVTLSYWTYCRHKWDEEVKQVDLLSEKLKKNTVADSMQQNEIKEAVSV